MERRHERNRHPESRSDAWSEAWGDRALQCLGRNLVRYGMPAEQAAVAVEQVWLFYSYVALPALPEHVPMGIATTKGEDMQPGVCLYLPHKSVDALQGDPEFSQARQRLEQRFVREFADPIAPDLVLNLKFVSAAPAKVARFEQRLRRYCDYIGLDYAGVFLDDLEDELKTVMNPREVKRWLRTPNTIFGGRKPAEFLRDPRDRRLRDIITRAKFNLPAA